MTVANQTNRISSPGNDSATTFSFSPMVVNAASEISVTHVDASGTETTISQGTGATNWKTALTVFPATGSIIYPADEVTPLPTGEKLIIRRILVLENQTDLENQGGYDPEVLEQQLDKLIMIDLQQQEEIDRAFKAAVGEGTLTDPVMPNTAAGTAGDALLLSSDKTALEWGAISGTLPDPVTVARGGTGATTASGALTNLGAAGLASNTFTGTQRHGGTVRWDHGADVASAAALTLGTDGNAFDITGTTTITSIATQGVGTVVLLQFDGALTITHHATNLVLPDGENILTEAGDIGIFEEYTAGGWRLVSWVPAGITQLRMSTATRLALNELG